MVGDIDIVCPSCKVTGHVPIAFAGKDVRCKKCQTHFRVPTAGPPAAPVSPMPPGRTLGDSVELAPPPPDEEAHAQARFMARPFGQNRRPGRNRWRLALDEHEQIARHRLDLVGGADRKSLRAKRRDQRIVLPKYRG